MITPRIKPSPFFASDAPSDLFIQQHRRAKLGRFVANLAAIDALVDFEAVATAVDAACPRADRSKGGRPPYPTQKMVRMLFLQALYNLSDEETEHQVLDRTSFQRCCRFEGELNIPDARTIWAFKQRLVAGDMGGKAIFDAVSQQLQRHGFIPRGGQMVDATIVQAPITRTPEEERQALNEGRMPDGWSERRMQHTGGDARWTKKHGKSFYGYKLHGNVDARYKLIRKVQVTSANVDDGQTLPQVVDPSNTRSRLLADRGYDSEANRELLHATGVKDGVARRAYPRQVRKQGLKQRNAAINRQRARVEHAFAGLHQRGGKMVRAMTLARNTLALKIKCAVYNAKRLAWLATNERPTWDS